MNQPTEKSPTRGPLDDRLLDRLVDGELPEGERRELLLGFDNEPNGWRRCALAFLEAQTWRQALRLLVTAEKAPDKSVWLTAPTWPRRPWRVAGRLTGLAAGLAVAFALGWGFHEGPERPPHAERVVQGTAPFEPTPSKTAKVETPNPAKPPDLARLDPFVKACQEHGYSVESQQRLVSVELNDGRKVKIPVQEVRLVYMGDRTY